MLYKSLSILFLLCICSLTFFAQRKMPVTFVKADSGDVLTVTDTHHKEVKLLIPFIESPTKDHPEMFAIARQHLEDLVKNKSLEVVVLDVGFGYYDVLFGTLLANGTDIGLQMIRDGAAWHYISKDSIQTEAQKKIYLENQELAQTGNLGVWNAKILSPTESKKLKTEKYKKLIPLDFSEGYIHETKAQLVENWSLYETDEIRVSDLLAVKADLFNKFNHGRISLFFILFADKNSYTEDSKIKIIGDGKEIPLFFNN